MNAWLWTLKHTEFTK